MLAAIRNLLLCTCSGRLQRLQEIIEIVSMLENGAPSAQGRKALQLQYNERKCAEKE